MKISGITTLALALLLPQTAFPLRRVQSIRSIDFKNFTYPRVGEQRSYIRRKTFTLKSGEYSEHEIEDGMHFGDVVYGDLTDDGIEEAIVILGIQTRGSAIPDCVYIYTLKKNRPHLLWGFETGDRADGGLKDVHIENGKLVLELYGKDKVIGRNLYADDGTKNGDCCPTVFTRTQYIWRNNHFKQKGKAELFPLSK